MALHVIKNGAKWFLMKNKAVTVYSVPGNSNAYSAECTHFGLGGI